MISLSNKRILVTGGARFLRKQIIEQLTLAGAVPHNITIPRSRNYDLRYLDLVIRPSKTRELTLQNGYS